MLCCVECLFVMMDWLGGVGRSGRVEMRVGMAAIRAVIVRQRKEGLRVGSTYTSTLRRMYANNAARRKMRTSRMICMFCVDGEKTASGGSELRTWLSGLRVYLRILGGF